MHEDRVLACFLGSDTLTQYLVCPRFGRSLYAARCLQEDAISLSALGRLALTSPTRCACVDLIASFKSYYAIKVSARCDNSQQLIEKP